MVSDLIPIRFVKAGLSNCPKSLFHRTLYFMSRDDGVPCLLVVLSRVIVRSRAGFSGVGGGGEEKAIKWEISAFTGVPRRGCKPLLSTECSDQPLTSEKMTRMEQMLV